MITEMLTLSDICRITKVSSPTALNWIHDEDPEKRLLSSRLGGKIMVRPEDFDNWLVRNRTAGRRRSASKA